MKIINLLRMSMLVGALTTMSLVVTFTFLSGPLFLISVPICLWLGFRTTKQLGLEYVESLLMPSEEELKRLGETLMNMVEAEMDLEDEEDEDEEL